MIQLRSRGPLLFVTPKGWMATFGKADDTKQYGENVERVLGKLRRLGEFDDHPPDVQTGVDIPG